MTAMVILNFIAFYGVKTLNLMVLEGTKVIPADTLVDDGYKIKGSKKTLTILKPSKVSEERSDRYSDAKGVR